MHAGVRKSSDSMTQQTTSTACCMCGVGNSCERMNDGGGHAPDVQRGTLQEAQRRVAAVTDVRIPLLPRQLPASAHSRQFRLLLHVCFWHLGSAAASRLGQGWWQASARHAATASAGHRASKRCFRVGFGASRSHVCTCRRGPGGGSRSSSRRRTGCSAARPAPPPPPPACNNGRNPANVGTFKLHNNLACRTACAAPTEPG